MGLFDEVTVGVIKTFALVQIANFRLHNHLGAGNGIDQGRGHDQKSNRKGECDKQVHEKPNCPMEPLRLQL